MKEQDAKKASSLMDSSVKNQSMKAPEVKITKKIMLKKVDEPTANVSKPANVTLAANVTNVTKASVALNVNATNSSNATNVTSAVQVNATQNTQLE